MNLFTDLWYQALFTVIKRELEEEFLGFSLNELPIWNEITKINSINEFLLGYYNDQFLYDYSLIVQKKNARILMKFL